MNGTRNGGHPQGSRGNPGKPNRTTPQPAPERVPSSYSTSSKQQRTPMASTAQESCFPNTVEEDDEDLGPPEMTEASHGATIRLVFRFQELREVVGMWTDFRQGVPNCDASVWASGYYVGELCRSFKLVKRAYFDVQQLRSYGAGTEHPTSLEDKLAAMIETIDDWETKNIRNPARNDRSSQRQSANFIASIDSAPPTPSRATPGTNLVVYTPSNGSRRPADSVPKSQPQSPVSQRLSSKDVHVSNYDPDPRPSKEDLQAHIRKMTAFMNVITKAVQECRLTRDQMDSGLKSLRQVLLTLQRDAIEEMRQESEQEHVSKRSVGNLQLVRS